MQPNDTIFVLTNNYLGSPAGTLCEPTTYPNVYRIQGTAKFVGASLVRQEQVTVEQTTSAVMVGAAAPTAFSAADIVNLLNGSLAVDSVQENNAINTIKSHVATFNINVGDNYRYYTRSTNRWDLATFEMTGTDIGRILAGFAVKVPSRRSTKRKLLTALNTVYGLMLSTDEIQVSVTN